MLSNGLGIHLGGSKLRQLILSYTSDFTSDNDGWQKDSQASLPLNKHNGTPTITANQTIDGTGGWLKIVYGADQTFSGGVTYNYTGVMEKNLGLSGGFKKNDLMIVSFKIYLYHDGSTDHWNTGTDDVKMRHAVFNPTASFDLELNTTHTISEEKLCNTNGPGPEISFPGTATNYSDRPANGATWYLKDYNFELWR